MGTWYLIGSLKNPQIPEIGNAIRALGLEAFDDWWGAGHEADDWWQRYENTRGRTYKEALAGFAAQTVFNFDKRHLDRCDGAILVLPAGRSGHLEFGYAVGSGKKGFILFDKTPERYDVMYNFATDVYFDLKDLLNELAKTGN
jgi:hypothetical protein